MSFLRRGCMFVVLASILLCGTGERGGFAGCAGLSCRVSRTGMGMGMGMGSRSGFVSELLGEEDATSSRRYFAPAAKALLKSLSPSSSTDYAGRWFARKWCQLLLPLKEVASRCPVVVLLEYWFCAQAPPCTTWNFGKSHWF